MWKLPATVEKGDVVTTGVRMEEINSYVLLMTSRALLEETLDTIGIERFRAKPAHPETFLQRMKFRIKEAVRSDENRAREPADRDQSRRGSSASARRFWSRWNRRCKSTAGRIPT